MRWREGERERRMEGGKTRFGEGVRERIESLIWGGEYAKERWTERVDGKDEIRMSSFLA
ncbi:MAG: hypothetical protein ACRDE2_05355 [Chitinophagaceae bacterium]